MRTGQETACKMTCVCVFERLRTCMRVYAHTHTHEKTRSFALAILPSLFCTLSVHFNFTCACASRARVLVFALSLSLIYSVLFSFFEELLEIVHMHLPPLKDQVLNEYKDMSKRTVKSTLF